MGFGVQPDMPDRRIPTTLSNLIAPIVDQINKDKVWRLTSIIDKENGF